MLWSKIFFCVGMPVAEAVAVSTNGTKTLLAKGVSTFFITENSAVINGLRKLGNPPFWLVFF